MKLWKKVFRFAKRVAISALKAIKEFFVEAKNNVFGVIGCSAMAVGFTKLAVEAPFYIQTPLWIEASMAAPLIGLALTYLCILGMRWQLKTR